MSTRDYTQAQNLIQTSPTDNKGSHLPTRICDGGTYINVGGIDDEYIQRSTQQTFIHTFGKKQATFGIMKSQLHDMTVLYDHFSWQESDLI
jgi:hypothetical protein